MKKMLMMSTALLTLASGASMAADLSRPRPAPAPVYTKAPPMAPIFSWTGCYIGGNGGGVWVDKTITNAAAVTIGNQPFAAGVQEGSVNFSGGIGGGQVGCNYQVSSWVFGIQGDFDWSGASTTFTDALFPTTDSIKVKSLTSVTGRVGYAWDRFLVYAKGGGAWESDDYTFTGAGGSLTVSDTRTGWTVGGGGEYAFLDWLTGFVEYDFYDFGTKTESLTGALGTAAVTVSSSVKETKSVAKAGLNFKFGGWH